MSIEFKILTFYSMSEKQLQKCLRLKKSVTSLPTMIGTLSSTLGPHPESDLATYLYSDSTLIAIIDEFGHRISFNSLKKFVTSFSAVIRALGSPLGSCPERYLATDLYSVSTPIDIKTNLIARSISDGIKKTTASLQEMTKAYDSPLGSPPKIDLVTDLYSVSALAADYDEMGSSDSNDLFRSLNT
jgi:hypothetical protein